MNRKREQADLLIRLGMLFGPLIAVVRNPESFDADERQRILARYLYDAEDFQRETQIFTTSEPGHNYLVVLASVVEWLSGFRSNFRPGRSDPFEKAVEVSQRISDFILSIPVPVDSAIHEAHAPFSTYCLVRDLCTTAKAGVVWLDRYFDQTIFHRFFADTPSTVCVMLVTWPESKWTSSRDKRRHAEFMDISRLFAEERGPDGYRLVVNEDFHDRWLRCDDKLFALGGSIKDIGREAHFTISRLDGTPENLKHFDDAVTGGAELQQPSDLPQPGLS